MTAPPGRAIHCPEAPFPGAVTRRRSGQAGDPAGVPFRQLIRIPSGVPADTGNPCPPPLRRHRPIRTFRRTPRLIQHHACKTIWGGARVIISSVNGGLLMFPVSCFCVLSRHLLVPAREVRVPGPRPGEAGGTRRRGWPGRTWPGEAGAGGPGEAGRERCAGEALHPHASGAFERTTGPRRPALNSRAFYRIHVRIPAGKTPRIFLNSRRKMVDGCGKAR